MEGLLIPFSSCVYAADWIYQQNNAAMQNSKVTMEWFTKKQ